jgi:hypothetical protein
MSGATSNAPLTVVLVHGAFARWIRRRKPGCCT